MTKIMGAKLRTFWICRRICIMYTWLLGVKDSKLIDVFLQLRYCCFLKQIFKLATMLLFSGLHLLSPSKCQECTWSEWETANSSPMMSLMSATCHTAHPAQRWLPVYKNRPSRAAHFLHWEGDNSVWGSSSLQDAEIRQKISSAQSREYKYNRRLRGE